MKRQKAWQLLPVLLLVLVLSGCAGGEKCLDISEPSETGISDTGGKSSTVESTTKSAVINHTVDRLQTGSITDSTHASFSTNASASMMSQHKPTTKETDKSTSGVSSGSSQASSVISGTGKTDPWDNDNGWGPWVK